MDAISERLLAEHGVVSEKSMRSRFFLDNLPAHTGEAAAAMVEACAARRLFLPPCSSDLTPIEMLVSQLKALLRKAEHRTVDALWITSADLISCCDAQECTHDIRRAG